MTARAKYSIACLFLLTLVFMVVFLLKESSKVPSATPSGPKQERSLVKKAIERKKAGTQRKPLRAKEEAKPEPAEPPLPTYFISGIVKNYETGEPISNAEVSCRYRTASEERIEKEAVTNVQGNYAVECAEPDVLIEKLVARADGFCSEAGYSHVKFGPEPPYGRYDSEKRTLYLDIELAGPDACISGRAIGEDGQPLKEFSISVQYCRSRDHIKNSKEALHRYDYFAKVEYMEGGHFKIGNLHPEKGDSQGKYSFFLQGKYTLIGESQDLVPVILREVPAGAARVEMIFKKTGASLEGVALEEESNKPVSGVLVYLYGQHTINEVFSREDGHFVFSRLPPGNYLLKGEADANRGLLCFPVELALTETEERKDVVLVFTKKIGIFGKTINKETGEVLPNVSLACSSTFKSSIFSKEETTSDEEGKFTFQDPIEEGSYAFYFLDRSGNKVLIDEFHINPAERQMLELKVPPRPQIEGLVVDSLQKPQENANVLAFQADSPAFQSAERTTTDSKGRFSFYRLPAGEYRLEATKHPGSATELNSVKVNVVEGTTVEEVSLILKMGASIFGNVTDDRGLPVKDITVFCNEIGKQRLYSSAYGGRTLVSTDEKGFYRFDGIGNDRVSLYPYSRGYSGMSSDTTVVHEIDFSKTEIRQDFSIPELFPISGRVVDMAGNPVDRILISYKSVEEGHRGGTITEDDGTFCIKVLGGSFNLELKDHKVSPAQLLKVVENIPAGTEDLEIVLDETFRKKQKAIVEGVVLDALTGKPVPHAEVHYFTKGFGGSTYTNVDGTFRLEADPGEVRLSASHKDYVSFHLDPITAGEGQKISNIKIPLGKEGVRLEVFVVDEDKNPVADAVVMTYIEEKLTDSYGCAVMGKISPRGGDTLLIYQDARTRRYVGLHRLTEQEVQAGSVTVRVRRRE